MTQPIAARQGWPAIILTLMLASATMLLSSCAGPNPAPYTPVNADYER